MNMLENIRRSERGVSFGRKLKTQAIILGGFVLLIWLLEIIDWLILKGSTPYAGGSERHPVHALLAR
jgi:hypothetical protein